MGKIKAAVIFGGKSSEHDISKISATTVIKNMSKDKYDVIPVYISKSGEWFIYSGDTKDLSSQDFTQNVCKAVLSPDTSHKGLIKTEGDKAEIVDVDIVFPVIHGKGGEDGTLQGLLELSGIPYTGCGVLCSAISLDKAFTKLVAASVGVKQAKYVVFYRYLLEKDIEKYVSKAEESVGYPCFVKPSNAGSSVGISKVSARDELLNALRLAMKHDRTVIVEAAVKGREVECAVLGNNDVTASVVGEIKAADSFYSYDAKYADSNSLTLVPADISHEISEKIRESAVNIFKAVDGCGLSRVDFFIEDDTNDVIFNEINTMPGFTSISMYPMLFNACGIKTHELVDKIIKLGFERALR